MPRHVGTRRRNPRPSLRMIPISDENPTLRTPVMTYLLLATLLAVWVLVQGAGADPRLLAATVCDLGMVPGELTHLVPVGSGIPMGNGMACVIDNDRINLLTPLTSMFLHGGWLH